MTAFVESTGWFIATLLVYAATRELGKRVNHPVVNPLLLAFLGLGVLLKVSGASFAHYRESTRPLTWLIGPSVVALGFSLERRLDELREHARATWLALTAGAVAGVVSVGASALALHLAKPTVLSLLPKSATTLAAPMVERLGGDASLAAVVVLLVGIFGAVVGPRFLGWLGVRDRLALGLALGAGAHLVGTKRASELGPEEQGAAAAALVLHGFLTVVAAWVFARVVLHA